MKRNRTSLCALVGMAISVAIVACGSDDDAASTPDAAAPAPTEDAATDTSAVDSPADAADAADASTSDATIDAHIDGGYGPCDDAGWCPVLSAGIPIRGGFSAAANDSWVSMDHGKLAHYDGSAWAYDQLATYVDATGSAAMWGASGTSLWAALDGTGPTAQRVFHWNGTAWSALTLTLTDGDQLAALWGRDATRAWVVTTGGKILSCTTTACTVAMSTTYQLTSVHSSGASDAWVGGVDNTVSPQVAVALHFDGAAWTRKNLPADWDGNLEYVAVTGIFTTGSTNAWAISQSGTHLSHWNGTAWSELTYPVQTPSGNYVYMSRLVGRDASHLVVGTEFGDVLTYDGATWRFEGAIGSVGNANVSGLWLTPASSTWAVTSSNTSSTVYTRVLH